MALTIPTGKSGRFFLIAACIFGFSAPLFAQTPACTVGALVPTIHQEGLSEQISDISLICTGPAVNTSTLFVILNANVTNRLDASGNLTGVGITGGASTAIPPLLTTPSTILFNSVQLSGANATFNITGIRVASPTIASSGIIVTASVVASQLSTPSQPVNVALARPTLLASIVNTGISCLGSPAPATMDFPGLIGAGTSASAVRVTEANTLAFAPKIGNADSGIRFLVTLAGYGSNTVYVPDVIVGNQVPTQTSGGVFGVSEAGGTYTPNNNQLLLTRVAGADSTGAGGTLFLATVPGTATSFTSVTQVPLVNGTGTVTYEVLAANSSITDSGQIPVFVVASPYNCAMPLSNTLAVQLAPVSNVSMPTQTDPIPRFLSIVPPSDCGTLGDCGAPYFPQLQVSPTSVTLTGSSLGPAQTGFVTITDGSQATQLSFTVSASYQTASGLSSANWLTINGTPVAGTSPTTINGLVSPSAGLTSFVINVNANPAQLLIPGTYQATLTINAGSVGMATIPVTFTVGQAGVVIQSVVNAANGQAGPVTAGSFVSIYGLNLVSKNSLVVAFDGFPATVSYDGQPSGATYSQINALVPAALGAFPSAGLIVTVDGTASPLYPISLVTNAPSVFNPGILNQPAANGSDTVNSASVPASDGDTVQVFLTGLATPPAGQVTVTIGSATGLIPAYVGAVPSIPGLEQVNVQVPSTLQFSNGSAQLSVCVPGGTPACSVPVPLYLH